MTEKQHVYVTRKCPVCGMDYRTRHRGPNWVSAYSCKTCRGQYNRMQQEKHMPDGSEIQINGCKLIRTSKPERCRGWIDGDCSEEHYAACLNAVAHANWPGWRVE